MSDLANSKVVHLLDYGAGNVRSVRNSIQHLGYTVIDITSPSQIDEANVLIFPGVGSFGAAMEFLTLKGYVEPLTAYINADRHFMGICLGMQVFFDSSEESPGVKGLSIVPGEIKKFKNMMETGSTSTKLSVPSIGWNGIIPVKSSTILSTVKPAEDKVYFVHSYHASQTEDNKKWVLSTTNYGIEYVSSIGLGNVYACQFHPEKSGAVGLQIMESFICNALSSTSVNTNSFIPIDSKITTTMAKRVIACLDVRGNDNGDLVVTKGDQYDVREEGSGDDTGKGKVINMGKPVELARRYYDEGADEITFLNITSFRSSVLGDLPMLNVLAAASETIFVPLTVGGGIRDYNDGKGNSWTALDVASAYFRAGADKVSIGSDAVYAAEDYIKTGGVKNGNTSIEQISHVYGAQAVVISVDPKRVYVSSPDDSTHHVIKASIPGPSGEKWCWYQCTVKGGREARDLDAFQLCTACEALGAGEILLNCVDQDGTNAGYDLAFVEDISNSVNIPVIASSGAGKPSHFVDVFKSTGVEAALAAGIFHRKEVSIREVKKSIKDADIPCRN